MPGTEPRIESNERWKTAQSGRWVGVFSGGRIRAKTGLPQRDCGDSASGRAVIRRRIMVESVLGAGSGGEWAVVFPILKEKQQQEGKERAVERGDVHSIIIHLFFLDERIQPKTTLLQQQG